MCVNRRVFHCCRFLDCDDCRVVMKNACILPKAGIMIPPSWWPVLGLIPLNWLPRLGLRPPANYPVRRTETTTMQHYPHHIGDFDKATRHLSRVERSVYRDLLDVYYDTEKPLTLDTQQLCRRIVARSSEESTAVEQVLNEFFTHTPLGWYHARCEDEIEKYRANTSQKAVAGKASAAKRALKRQQALNARSTDVETPYNGTPTNQEPRTINQEPREGAGKPSQSGKPLTTLTTYIENQKQVGAKLIPENHAVLKYAESVGIPQEFLALAWQEFKARYTTSPDDRKKYRDWPGVFHKAVKQNWFKVWFIEADQFKLTTTGMQADKARRANVH